MQWRRTLRFLAALQLLPALENGEETLVGGQAVLEGVMMRSPHAWAIAVRRPAGDMVFHSEPLERLSDRHKWMGWPLVRGVVTLGQAMVLGFRALRFSANVALNEAQADQEPGKRIEMKGWVAALNILFSVGFFVFMYKFLPLLAATEIKRVSPLFGSQIVFNLVDGVVRILLFLAFIWGVSLWSDIRRVYQYHGAEHKTVFAFESGGPLTIPEAQRFSTFHPRCGTSFLMTVMIISIAVYTLVPVKTFGARFAVRLALLPFIAGASYEIIRFAAKARAKGLRNGKRRGPAAWLFQALTQPGLWLQRITTQPPSDDQVECAIAALNGAMDLEKVRGGEMVIA
jgi:uncharacterized protein YqhQ